MPRFKSNRWWTLILTLSLGCALLTATPALAEFGLIDDGGSTVAGGPVPPPPGAGDPDIPVSSGKLARRGAAQPAANISTSRVAGDGARVDGVMMWRFRVVLQSLRLWGLVRL